jgi:THO complex subunit 3
LSTDARATTELLGHTDGVEQIVWDPMHADRLASASGDKHVKFWDARQVKETASIQTPGANINVAFHPQGTYVAVGDRNDTISIIDARMCQSVGLVRSFGAAPSISADATAASWTSTDREEINEFSWTPDGRIFVLGTGSGNVRLLDARNTETLSVDTSVHSSQPALNWPLVHTIVGHTATVFCVRTDPLGRYLATASADSTTAIWSIDECFNVSMSGHLTYPARSISFSYDGEFLAAGGEDNFISITATAPMDATTVDSPLHKIPVSSAVNGLTWHPTRHCLAYAGDDRDGTIRIWGMS